MTKPLGKVFHTCGHECEIRPVSGFPLTLKGVEYDEDGPHNAVSYSTLCHKCYVKWVTDYPDDLLFEQYEVKEWLNG